MDSNNEAQFPAEAVSLPTTPTQETVVTNETSSTPDSEHKAVNPTPAAPKHRFVRKARPFRPNGALVFNEVVADKVKNHGYASETATQFVKAVAAAHQAKLKFSDAKMAHDTNDLAQRTEQLSARHATLRKACAYLGVDETSVMEDASVNPQMFLTKAIFRRITAFRDYGEIMLRPSRKLSKEATAFVEAFLSDCEQHLKMLGEDQKRALRWKELRDNRENTVRIANILRNSLFVELQAADRIKGSNWVSLIIDATDLEIERLEAAGTPAATPTNPPGINDLTIGDAKKAG